MPTPSEPRDVYERWRDWEAHPMRVLLDVHHTPDPLRWEPRQVWITPTGEIVETMRRA